MHSVSARLLLLKWTRSVGFILISSSQMLPLIFICCVSHVNCLRTLPLLFRYARALPVSSARGVRVRSIIHWKLFHEVSSTLLGLRALLGSRASEIGARSIAAWATPGPSLGEGVRWPGDICSFFSLPQKLCCIRLIHGRFPVATGSGGPSGHEDAP